jgi:hypothetical protein
VQAVAVSKLGGDAGCTPVWVTFADDNGFVTNLRVRSNDCKSIIDILKLGGNAYLYVALSIRCIDEVGASFGVERNKVKRTSFLPRGVQ